MSEMRKPFESWPEHKRRKDSERKDRFESSDSVETVEMHERIAEHMLNATPEDLKAFRDRIRNVNGTVRLAVHPLYIERHKNTFGKSQSRSAEDVHAELSQGFDRTLKSVGKSEISAPIIVFEEETFLKQTNEYISRVTGIAEKDLMAHGIAICPTDRGSGALSAKHTSKAYESVQPVPADEQYDALKAENDAMWEIIYPEAERSIPDFFAITPKEAAEIEQRRLETKPHRKRTREISVIFNGRRETVMIAIMKSLDLRNALISGAYFFESDSAGDKELSGCAGYIRTTLQSVGIKVDISKYSWTQREDLKAIGIITKETGRARESQPSVHKGSK